jgi:hypothetical protein
MVPREVSEGIDVFEMEIYVATGTLPFRYESVRTSLRLTKKPKLGVGCVMDLAPSLLRPGSLRICQVLSEVRYGTTRLLYEHSKATDERGDLALAYLAHLLANLPDLNDDSPSGQNLFGYERSFGNLITVVDLMVNFSPEYHFVVHEHMLRGMPANALQSDVQARIAEALRITEYAELHAGMFHGAMGVDRLESLIRETSSVGSPSYRTGLQCAIELGEWAEQPPPAHDAPGASGTPPPAASPSAAPPAVASLAAAPPRWHYFAVAWETHDETQQEELNVS